MTMRHISLLLSFCLVVAEAGAIADESLPPIEFSMKANKSECIIGTPILVKLTIRNTGLNEYRMRGGVGWGQMLHIFVTNEEGVERILYPDVLQIVDSYMPVYVFTGAVLPGRSQSIVHFLKTRQRSPGPVRFKALMKLGGHILWTPELSVNLLHKLKDDKSRALSAEEDSFIYRYVAYRHNRFERGSKYAGGRDREKLLRIVKKAIGSDEASLACEYALYAGVLQAIDVLATPEDTKLAEEAAAALEKRFPDSWLRAYAFAMLSVVHFEKGNLEKARGYAEKGLKLPESQPVYENLKIMAKLKSLDTVPHQE